MQAKADTVDEMPVDEARARLQALTREISVMNMEKAAEVLRMILGRMLMVATLAGFAFIAWFGTRPFVGDLTRATCAASCAGMTVQMIAAVRMFELPWRRYRARLRVAMERADMLLQEINRRGIRANRD